MVIPFEQLNWIDGIIIFFFIWGFFWGMIRGLTGEIFKLFGIVVGFIVAVRYCNILGAFINTQNWAEQEVVNWLAFFLLFILIFLFFFFLAKLFNFLLRKIFLGWLDRLLGAFFGAIRGVVLIGIILTLVVIVVGEKARVIIEDESYSGRNLVGITHKTWAWVYQYRKKILEKEEETGKESEDETERSVHEGN
ncbi:CvpA family protein [Chlamydiota bacterium]